MFIQCVGLSGRNAIVHPILMTYVVTGYHHQTGAYCALQRRQLIKAVTPLRITLTSMFIKLSIH